MFDTYFDEHDDVYAGENAEKHWDSTSSTIFLVDVTEPMCQNDHLLFCFQTYRNIVVNKCSDNKRDKVGLVVFGTKDTNCDIDNVRVLQKFEMVTIDTLKNADTELQDINKYKDSASRDKYPLYNALSYVLQTLHISKVNTKTSNTVILCTCQANPKLDSPVERRRIEDLVASFKDEHVKLLVAGLGDSWDDEIFYKDLQIISGTFTNNDYIKINLETLKQTISSSSKSICKLPWKITSNLAISVSLNNLISKYKYPSKVKLQMDNNEILETRRIFQEFDMEDFPLDQSMESIKTRKITTEENIVHYITYAGLNINFKPYECKQIKVLCSEISIETLAFKPIACDPLYHAKPPYFVTYTTVCSHENKMLFRSFVNKCSKKKVMPVCKIATSCAFFIGMMIPSEDDGGFYMYKMPFNDKIRDLDSHLGNFIFNSEKQCPINNEAVHVFKKLIRFSKVKFDTKTFRNPKLEKYLAHIEALALDKELGPLPLDSTVPPSVNSEVEQLSKTLMTLLNLVDKTSRKRSKLEKLDNNKRQKLDVQVLMQSKKLHMLTVVELKEILKDIKESTQGNKSNLVERIYNHFNE